MNTAKGLMAKIAGRSVAIVGAGTQGRRLAYMWSSLGGPVNIIDRDPAQCKNALIEVDHYRSKIGIPSKRRDGQIKTFLEDEKELGLKDSWLVIECIPESLTLKKDIFRDLDKILDADVIIASNSSSYTIADIMAGVTYNHPERMVSLHSYWPPETTAIEIMASALTRPDIIPLLMQLCKAHGFSPFEVRKESVGYIYNRIWAAIKREALLVVADDIATPGEVDEIFKNILKSPKGPFEQMDVVGLDVVLDIEEHYAETRSGIPEKPRELLKRYLKDRRLGVKSGSGFYEYQSDSAE